MEHKEEIVERLLRLDEDASLLFEGNERFSCILVGGSAMILLGYLSRATHDIDVLRTPRELMSLFDKYDMNNNVSAHMDNFPDDYLDRVKKLDLPTRKVDYYSLSLEDLVISKLAAARDKDIFDITSPTVLKALDWDVLAGAAEMVKMGMLNDRIVSEFEAAYSDYTEMYRPCEN